MARPINTHRARVVYPATPSYPIKPTVRAPSRAERARGYSPLQATQEIHGGKGMDESGVNTRRRWKHS